ncbi:DUF485 domain-containing protein [Streptomyces sp. NPDC020801]|uniref:DUF485 domain-containing protein n=1 Tax=unclassified Streptomyces TaxID=2593676 RepID=UPI00379676FE
MNGPYAAPPPEETTGEPDLGELRRSRLGFAVPAAVLVVGGHLLFILLSGFTPGAVDFAPAGHLTLGLALGLAVFGAIFITAWRYERHMRARVDPHADEIRTRHAHLRRDGKGQQ